MKKHNFNEATGSNDESLSENKANKLQLCPECPSTRRYVLIAQPEDPEDLLEKLGDLLQDFGQWWGHRHAVGPDRDSVPLDYDIVVGARGEDFGSHGHLEADLDPGDKFQLGKMAAARGIEVMANPQKSQAKQYLECDSISLASFDPPPLWVRRSRMRREGRQDGYFGLCPECHLCDGMVNVGSSHWLFCEIHKLKWCFGANLFSSWRYETRRVQQKSRELIASFEGVEPYFHPETLEELRASDDNDLDQESSGDSPS